MVFTNGEPSTSTTTSIGSIGNHQCTECRHVKNEVRAVREELRFLNHQIALLMRFLSIGYCRCQGCDLYLLGSTTAAAATSTTSTIDQHATAATIVSQQSPNQFLLSTNPMEPTTNGDEKLTRLTTNRNGKSTAAVNGQSADNFVDRSPDSAAAARSTNHFDPRSNIGVARAVDSILSSLDHQHRSLLNSIDQRSVDSTSSTAAAINPLINSVITAANEKYLHSSYAQLMAALRFQSQHQQDCVHPSGINGESTSPSSPSASSPNVDGEINNLDVVQVSHDHPISTITSATVLATSASTRKRPCDSNPAPNEENGTIGDENEENGEIIDELDRFRIKRRRVIAVDQLLPKLFAVIDGDGESEMEKPVRILLDGIEGKSIDEEDEELDRSIEVIGDDSEEQSMDDGDEEAIGDGIVDARPPKEHRSDADDDTSERVVGDEERPDPQSITRGATNRPSLDQDDEEDEEIIDAELDRAGIDSVTPPAVDVAQSSTASAIDQHRSTSPIVVSNKDRLLLNFLHHQHRLGGPSVMYPLLPFGLSNAFSHQFDQHLHRQRSIGIAGDSMAIDETGASPASTTLAKVDGDPSITVSDRPRSLNGDSPCSRSSGGGSIDLQPPKIGLDALADPAYDGVFPHRNGLLLAAPSQILPTTSSISAAAVFLNNHHEHHHQQLKSFAQLQASAAAAAAAAAAHAAAAASSSSTNIQNATNPPPTQQQPPTHHHQLTTASLPLITQGPRMSTFYCTICNRDFSNVYYKRHMIVHANARPYVCDVCGKRFNERSNMMKHKQRLHGP